MNYNKAIDALISPSNNGKVIRAVEYVSPKLIIRAVRRTFNKKIYKGSNIEIMLTIGRPNYLEREFIEECLKAKEPFPIKRVQLKLYNPKPKKLLRK